MTFISPRLRSASKAVILGASAIDLARSGPVRLPLTVRLGGRNVVGELVAVLDAPAEKLSGIRFHHAGKAYLVEEALMSAVAREHGLMAHNTARFGFESNFASALTHALGGRGAAAGVLMQRGERVLMTNAELPAAIYIECAGTMSVAPIPRPDAELVVGGVKVRLKASRGVVMADLGPMGVTVGPGVRVPRARIFGIDAGVEGWTLTVNGESVQLGVRNGAAVVAS